MTFDIVLFVTIVYTERMYIFKLVFLDYTINMIHSIQSLFSKFLRVCSSPESTARVYNREAEARREQEPANDSIKHPHTHPQSPRSCLAGNPKKETFVELRDRRLSRPETVI
jgi:hypothetical protein